MILANGRQGRSDPCSGSAGAQHASAAAEAGEREVGEVLRAGAAGLRVRSARLLGLPPQPLRERLPGWLQGSGGMAGAVRGA